MSKLALTVRIPPDYNRQTWANILSQIQTQVNNLSEGSISASFNAFTSRPTTGTYAQGDFIKNSKPAALGNSPNQYIVAGWICIVSGEPGTWTECRFLIGNDTINTFAGSIAFTGAAPTVT